MDAHAQMDSFFVASDVALSTALVLECFNYHVFQLPSTIETDDHSDVYILECDTLAFLRVDLQ